MGRVVLLFAAFLFISNILCLCRGGRKILSGEMCSWFHARGTWDDGFFPGAGSILLFTL